MTHLSATGLGKRYGARVVFRNLALEAAGGRTLAITGRNGTGKSTLVRILAGVLRPTRGQVVLTVDGRSVDQQDRPFSAGLVAPYLNLYDRFSPRENLKFIARARSLTKPDSRIDELLALVGLADRADDHVGTFSSGMVQRMRFAAALVADPPLLVLDEPTSNLDDPGREIVARIVASSCDAGRVILVATNDPNEAAACDDRINVQDFQ